MESTEDQSIKPSKTVQIVAVIDLLIAVVVICIITYQFGHGTSLVEGTHLTEAEKAGRLAFYAALVYAFLFIQMAMAYKLFRSGRDMLERPISAIKQFRWWREWSIVYLLVVSLHAILVVLLMEGGQRKAVSLICMAPQLLFRPFGIGAVGNMKKRLEGELPSKF